MISWLLRQNTNSENKFVILLETNSNREYTMLGIVVDHILWLARRSMKLNIVSV